MAKLAILAAVLLVLLALGRASAFRTSVTTTVVEEENQPGPPCREQIQRQQQLRECQSYLRMQRRQIKLAMMTDENQQQQQQLRQCCQQLESLEEQCRCQGVEEAMRQQQQRGEMRAEERQQMMQEAENLPDRCNLSPRRCQIGTVWF